MAIGKISEEIKSAQDYILDGVTVPKNTSTTSSAKLVGGTNGQIELVVNARTAIALADTKVLTVALTGSDTEGGSYTALRTLYTKTASGATTIAAGTELARYVFNSIDPLYVKAVVTTTDAAATGTIEAYPRQLHS